MLYATGFIGYFYLIIPIVGFGASALVGRELIRQIDAGGNMAAPLVAELLGGTPFLGFIAAVAFATILAVVAGLTLAGASALSHDIFTARRPQRHGDRGGADARRADRDRGRSALVAVGPRHRVQGAERRVHGRPGVRGRRAARTFPPLLLSIVWRRFNTRGAVCAIVAGRGCRPSRLIVLSPTIWVDLLHQPAALFPLRNPAIVSMPLSFLCGRSWLRWSTREPAAEARFDDEKLRTYPGYRRRVAALAIQELIRDPGLWVFCARRSARWRLQMGLQVA